MTEKKRTLCINQHVFSLPNFYLTYVLTNRIEFSSRETKRQSFVIVLFLSFPPFHISFLLV